MITRRGFFGLIAALPVLKNWQVKPEPLIEVFPLAMEWTHLGWGEPRPGSYFSNLQMPEGY